VLNATAAATVGAVGTYGFVSRNSAVLGNPGTTASGSLLRWFGLSTNKFGITAQVISSPIPSGTWRAMGVWNGTDGAFATNQFTVCLRIL
jgi:hypothetical protein